MCWFILNLCLAFETSFWKELWHHGSASGVQAVYEVEDSWAMHKRGLGRYVLHLKLTLTGRGVGVLKEASGQCPPPVIMWAPREALPALPVVLKVPPAASVISHGGSPPLWLAIVPVIPEIVKNLKKGKWLTPNAPWTVDPFNGVKRKASIFFSCYKIRPFFI